MDRCLEECIKGVLDEFINACTGVCTQACNECCDTVLEIFKILVIAALVLFAVVLLLVGLLVAFLLQALGLRTVLELLLVAIVSSYVLQVCVGYLHSGSWHLTAPASPVARYVTKKVGAFRCVARWGLQQLSFRLPSRSLAAASWAASCGLALAGRPHVAFPFIVAGAVLALAAVVAAVGPADSASSGGAPLQQPLLKPEVPLIPAAQLWDLFFDACRSIGAELLEREAGGGRRWLTRAELQELGPQTLVGLPALVLLRTALRGAVSKAGSCPEKALLLCSGQVLTSASVPKASAAQEAFQWMLEAQEALRGARVRHIDLPVLDGLVLWEGDLSGVEALSPGDDVECKEELTVRKAIFFNSPVPAGSHGVVQEVGKGEREVLVRWPQGSGLVQAPKLVKMSGDRPKPLEAQPSPEIDERLPKLRLAAGRARAVAMTVSAMPMFADHFQKTVVDPLVQGTAPPVPPELERTDTGGVTWRDNNSFNSLALGLAVEIGRARSRHAIASL